LLKILDLHGEEKQLIAAKDGILRDARSLEQGKHLRPHIGVRYVVRRFSPLPQPQKESNSLHINHSTGLSVLSCLNHRGEISIHINLLFRQGAEKRFLERPRFEGYSSFLLTLPPWRPDSLSRMNSRLQCFANLEKSALFRPANAANKGWRGARRSLVIIIAVLTLTCIASASAGKPQHLTCDSLEHPLGIDSLQPMFSWQLQDDGFAARQTAYRIEVATKPSLLSGKADVWDSGRIPSDKSFGVAYGGPQLAASTRYYWRVQLWNKDGKPYPASDASWWETGLLNES
jgi:hypothetical protein